MLIVNNAHTWGIQIRFSVIIRIIDVGANNIISHKCQAYCKEKIKDTVKVIWYVHVFKVN